MLAPEGGAVADQRHRADAGPAGAGGRRRSDCWSRSPTSPRAMSIEALLGTDRPYDERVQVIRPHPGPAGQRRQPAPPAGRLARCVASHRRERPRRAGLLLPALRAAGARRGPRRAGARPPGHRHRARLDRRQPGHRAATARSCRPATSTASRWRSPATCSRSPSPSWPASAERRIDRMLDPAFSRDLPRVPGAATPAPTPAS